MKHLLPFYILFISFLFVKPFAKAQTIITQWNFNSSFSAIAANGNGPAPSTGAGSLKLIGGTTATSAAGAASDPGLPNNALNTSTYPAQGAASCTAGLEVTMSTTGFKDIIFSYEQRNSGSAANTTCELEFDGAFTSTIAGTDFVTTSFGSSFTVHTFDLTGYTNLINNRPTVKFRIKTKFTGASSVYSPTDGTSNYASTGTIRYDLITVKGTPLACAGIPTQQATNIVFASTSLTTTQFIVNRGNGTHLLILAKAGSPVDANPVDGANYAGDRFFGNGSQIGAGNFVVYNNNPQTNSCLINVFGLTSGVEYYYAVYEYNGAGASPCYLAPALRGSLVCNSTLFDPGDLLFMGYDEDVEAGGQDGIWLTTLKEIKLGTTFSLINSRYEMGAAPSTRTHQWFAGGNNPNAALAQIKIRYNSNTPIPVGSVIHFQIDGSGIAGSFDVNNNGVNTFSATTFNSTSSFLSATANQEQDQLYLVQGDLTQYGIANSTAYSLLSGRVIHALSRQNDWVAFSATPSTGGTVADRFSRKPPQVDRTSLYFSGSNNGAAYYNGPRTGDRREVVNNISNVANWTKLPGTSAVNDVPNSIFNNFTGFFTSTSNYFWVGANSNDWFDANNWFCYSVPDSLANVDIYPTAILQPNFPIINLTNSEPATRHQNKAAAKQLVMFTSTTTGVDLLTLDGNGNDSLTVFDYFSCSSVSPILNMSIGGNNKLKFRGSTYYATNNITYGANSNTIFEGAYLQFLNTNDPGGIFFNQLTVNNPDSIAMQQYDMFIDKQLNLNLGKITSIFSTTNAINIKSSTAITSPTNAYGIANEGWEKSFVATRMAITNTANGVDKILPIGKGNVYAPIRLNKQNANTCKYTAEYFYYPPIDIFNVTPNLDHVSDREFWEISANNFTNINDAYTQVALSWRPTSFVTTIPVGNWQDSICVAHYFNPGAGNSNSWLMERNPPNPADIVTGNTNYGWVKTNRYLGNFSPFTLGSLSKFIPLPVKLLSFDANKLATAIQTNWQVVEEKEVKEYVVEKSDDGIHFSLLGKLNASNTNAAHSYAMPDVNPLIGWNYYRLKIVATNNDVSYSKIVRIQFGKNNSIIISPNPATSFLQVQNANVGSQLQIVNVDGKILQTKMVQSANEKLDVQFLAAGVYFVKVVSADETITQPFVKQ